MLVLSGFSVSFAASDSDSNLVLAETGIASMANEEVSAVADVRSVMDISSGEEAMNTKPDTDSESDSAQNVETVGAVQPVMEPNNAESDAEEQDPEDVIEFSDVQNPSAFYYRSVNWAVKKGLVNGMEKGIFAPENSCTRGQMIMMIWRMAGKPQPKSAVNPFVDVRENAFYRDAVLWAVEEGIATGTVEGKFAPEETCIRAQCLAFLWRYLGSPDDGGRSDFKDVPSDFYYAPAVFWALKNGITNGMPAGGFSPYEECTRAQAVTFFYRSMMEAVDGKDLSAEERPSGELQLAEAHARTGDFTLKAVGVAADRSNVEEVQAAVWTEDDQSDLRWFIMHPAEDGDTSSYAVTQNVKAFGRSFDQYHASLYLVLSSEESAYRVHMNDCDFEVVPQNYMYAENLGMGYYRVTVQGVAPEIDALQIIAWDQSNGTGAYKVYDAAKQEEGVWSVDFEMMQIMTNGVCGLTAAVPDTGVELNVILENVTIKKLIDVSQYQGTIDWNTAKESGTFDGVLMRCGLRNSKGNCVKDTKFLYNAQSCTELGIPMGVYWFTSALTVQEAIEEADYCASLLSSYPLSYPVFIDTEWGSRSGLNRLNKNKRTDCVIAFMRRMEEYGYDTGIYGSVGWFTGYMDFPRVASEKIWVASWNGRPSYPDYYIAWQYSNKVRIPGITQNVTDVSWWFE